MNYKSLAELWAAAENAMENPPQGVPLTWWRQLSEAMGGLRANELTLLCAPTGAGKTSLLANISAQLAMQKVPTFVAPVETGDVDFAVRVASALARKELNTGERFSRETTRRMLGQYLGAIQEAPLYIADYDNRVEVTDMLNLLKYQVQEHNVRVALLDNLNFFLKVVGSNHEKAEMDNAIHEFVMLAKKLPIHIILIVHPRKTDGGRVESEFDIKGSSTAVQEASNVLLFNRPKLEDIESGKRLMSDRELVFRKLRKRGYNVGKAFWLAYTGGRFEQLEFNR